jgi:hypothetical protein
MTPLSVQLANLSAAAKRAEDNFARAQAEAKEEFDHTRRLAREQAKEAIEDLGRKVANVQDATSAHWQAFKAKLQADGQRLKEDIAQDRREFSAWQKENYAQVCEEDAMLAIDYAAASIAMAENAVLDAVEARQQAYAAESALASPATA